MPNFTPMREVPGACEYGPNDVLVVFGEVFARGYVNGLIDEAKKRGMKVIYSTVGRRDQDDRLRALTQEELQEKDTPLINIPLEAGFDMEKSDGGPTPVEQLAGAKLSEWQSCKLNWEQVEQSREKGTKRFRTATETFLIELERYINKDSNVLFAHTMAGGVPRAKIMMPAMNRVFKGSGDRYASSLEFWQTDLGKFCDMSFMEVTANTLRHLIELSAPIRERQTANGKKVSYVAYGYHGNEIYINGEPHWQSYSPYLQGFAKLQLEHIAEDAFQNGVSASVFNAPEILTNSSSIFLGVEIALYPLIVALEKKSPNKNYVSGLVKKCEALLKEEYKFADVLKLTDQYFMSDIIQKWTRYDKWPQHNGPEQMELMRNTSNKLLEMHKDQKHLLTAELSEVVFNGCGKLMLQEAWDVKKPVWWLGHDIIAKVTEG